MKQLWQDLRFGARMLRKNPGFTLAAVLTLGLGIGANTTIFSIVESILLRPLPYKDSARLVNIYSSASRFRGFQLAVSKRDSDEIRSQNRSFGESAFYYQNVMNLIGRQEPEQVRVTEVSSEFFDLLGGRPVLGRFFLPSEQLSETRRVVVLSHDFWQTEYGGQANAIGKTLRLDDALYTIIGVTSSGFDVPTATGETATKVWLPVQPGPPGGPNPHYANTWGGSMLARLRPGVSLEEVNTELDITSARLQKEYPKNDTEWSVRAAQLDEEVVGHERPLLLILLGAAVLVLLTACANVANLLLSRSVQRRKEIAVRGALGASRARILRQLLTESALLALIGGGVGCSIALGGVSAFRFFAPPNTPRLAEIYPNWTFLWFTLAIALTSGTLFGLVPALQASRLDINTTLKEGGIGLSGSLRHRVHSAFVILEIALVLPLTIASALLVESLSKLMNVPTGMRTDHTVSVSLVLPQSKYPSQTEVGAFVRLTLDKIGSLPVIEDVTAADRDVLRRGGIIAGQLRFLGREEPVRPAGGVELTDVSPDFFRTLRISLLEGRAFTDQDVSGAPLVAIVNQRMAKLFWNGQDPIGTQLSYRDDEKGNPIWLSVVGLAGDTRDVSLDTSPQPELYTPIFQHSSPYIGILVRTQLEPLGIVSAIREQIWAVDKNQPIANIQTMDNLISQSVVEPRFRTLLLVAFAALGFALAMVGIYGVISYSASQQTHEIGIRMALGAQPGNVLAMIFRQGMSLVLAGLGIGLFVARALSRLMSNLLFGVKPTDTLAFLLGSVLLGGVALMACYIPARRATRVDPMVALRHE